MNHPKIETCSCPPCTVILAIECAVRDGKFALAEALTRVLATHVPEAIDVAAKVRDMIQGARSRDAASTPAINAAGCGVPS